MSVEPSGGDEKFVANQVMPPRIVRKQVVYRKYVLKNDLSTLLVTMTQF